MSKSKWYLANIIEYALIHDGKSKELLNESNIPYYENTILIKADNSEEAYRKAVKYGKVRVKYKNPDGDTVTWKFAGVRELVVIYSPLKDGEEIAYSEGYCRSEENIKKKIPSKNKLGVFEWERRMKKLGHSTDR